MKSQETKEGIILHKGICDFCQKEKSDLHFYGCYESRIYNLCGECNVKKY